MNALTYLTLTQLKNRVKQFVRRPVNLLVLLVFAGLLAFVIFTGNAADGETATRDITELYAIVAALFIGIYATTTYNGLKKGASCFALADVHLLFTAPVDSRKTLLYGLFKQMGTSLMLAFFLLYQYTWMHQFYGVTIGFLVALLVMYGLTVFAGQLTTLTLYGATANKPGARRACIRAIYVLSAAAAAYVAWRAFNNQANLLPELAAAAASPVVAFFPMGGWMAYAFGLLAGGQYAAALIPIAAFLASCAALVTLMLHTDADYFEDVLSATETTHAQLEAQKSGQIVELNQNAKAGRTGLGQGEGASVLFRKHLLESRRARKFLFDPMTMIFMVVIIGYAFFTRGMGIFVTLGFATYTQIFTLAAARWTRELQKPYVYLIPEKPFKKLCFCLMEGVLQCFAEAAITFTIVGVIIGLEPLEIAAAVLARFGLGLLLMAANLVIERLFPTVKAKALVLILYFACIILMAAPAIAAAVVLPIALGATEYATLISLLTLAATAALAGIIATFLCRNVLANSEVS